LELHAVGLLTLQLDFDGILGTVVLELEHDIRAARITTHELCRKASGARYGVPDFQVVRTRKGDRPRRFVRRQSWQRMPKPRRVKGAAAYMSVESIRGAKKAVD